jgi:nitrate/nitrite transporter NarK
MSSLHVGVLFAIPYIWTVIAMVLNSQHSDKMRERRGHVAAGLAWGGVFLLAGILASQHSPILSFTFVCLAGAGPYAALGPFWAIPTETLPRTVTGSAMGLVNAIGNLGGYFGPLVVGYLNQRTGNFLYGFGLLSLGLLVASALTFLLHPARGATRGKDVTGAK